MRALPDADLFLFVESSLMNAQQRLSEYRQGDFLTRSNYLSMLEDEIEWVRLGVQEMAARSV
jgi:hypothetical protein